MDCRVYITAGDLWARLESGGGLGQVGGGFSHESEYDLAAMVSDFLENGSGGADSRCSSDSDSGFCDLAHLSDKISYHSLSVDKDENNLLSVVSSLMLSINEAELDHGESSPFNASCIRFSLVKLLRLLGYDAAVCATRWQGSDKVPGGDHEYIDVVNYRLAESSERLIIDVDFRSHFEIARAVESYDRILSYLPVVYVGSLAKLKQLLPVMVEAARASLKQNSMPLPPWRSLAYLLAKWQSPYQRQYFPDQKNICSAIPSQHKQCSEHLKRLQCLLQSEIEGKCLLKPLNGDNNQRLKLERWRNSSFRPIWDV